MKTIDADLPVLSLTAKNSVKANLESDYGIRISDENEGFVIEGAAGCKMSVKILLTLDVKITDQYLFFANTQRDEMCKEFLAKVKTEGFTIRVAKAYSYDNEEKIDIYENLSLTLKP